VFLATCAGPYLLAKKAANKLRTPAEKAAAATEKAAKAAAKEARTPEEKAAAAAAKAAKAGGSVRTGTRPTGNLLLLLGGY